MRLCINGTAPPPVRLCAPGRRAAASVEFAIVAPALFLIVLGVIELGRAYLVMHQLTDAARNGCRAAVPYSVPGKSTSEIRTAVTNYLSSTGISGQTTRVLVNGVETEASNAVTDDQITVIVSIPASRITWVPGMRFITTATLSGRFSMRRE